MVDTDILYHSVPGGAIAYAWSHGPASHPLVMVHGLGDSAILNFRHRVARSPLAATPNLFIDLPGFGSSKFSLDHLATIDRYAEDMADLLMALHLQPMAVFGHSMGGNVAIHLAQKYPNLVDHLIVAEPLLHREHSVLASDIARFDEASFVARRFAMLIRATSLQAYRGDVAAAAFLDPLRRAHPHAMHRAACSLVASAHISLHALQSEIAIPRTFMVGSHTGVDTSGLELSGIPIVRIPNAGHFMLAEQEHGTTYAILKAIS